MPRTATLNKEDTQMQIPEINLDEEQNRSGNGASGGEKKRISSFMYALLPKMILNPYPLDFADGMDSYDFAREKCRRAIIAPLGFKSQKEWLDFAKSSWQWTQAAPDREAKSLAYQVLKEIQGLASQTQDISKINQLIKEKLAAVVEAE